MENIVVGLLAVAAIVFVLYVTAFIAYTNQRRRRDVEELAVLRNAMQEKTAAACEYSAQLQEERERHRRIGQLYYELFDKVAAAGGDEFLQHGVILRPADLDTVCNALDFHISNGYPEAPSARDLLDRLGVIANDRMSREG